MPELPEVETIMRAMSGQLVGATVKEIEFFRSDLRDPIPIDKVHAVLGSQPILGVERRSKYLVWKTATGYCLFHLGMTGRFAFASADAELPKHTHLRLCMQAPQAGAFELHFIDPRRFGRIAAGLGRDFGSHPFLSNLGVEPLAESDLATVLWRASRNRRIPIKSFLMDSSVVVGIGNIYAAETLFKVGIHPLTASTDLDHAAYRRIARAARAILRAAIASGGTTFRDFRDLTGSPGYFRLRLNVYGRASEPCRVCKTPIISIRQAGRSSFFCPSCQT